MKRFYTIIAMALVVTVASFAQMLPKGPVVPYSGIKRDMGASLKAKDNVLVTLPETAVVEDDWAIDAIYYYGEENTPYLNDNPISVAFDGSDVYFRGVMHGLREKWWIMWLVFLAVSIVAPMRVLTYMLVARPIL